MRLPKGLVSRLDLKLGVRTLLRHPALTVTSILALAVGIPIGMAPGHLAESLSRPLPEDTDGRIRAVRFWDTEANRAADPSLLEYERWTADLASFSSMGAFRRRPFRLGDGAEGGSTVRGAEMSASAFAVLGTPPLMGRLPGPDDEGPAAAKVVVMSASLWTTRFGGDPSIVGRVIQVGDEARTVVGVMPSGFAFPASEHLWVPLADAPPTEPSSGLPVSVFGRMASGVDATTAQESASAIVGRLAPMDPERYARRRVEVIPFGYAAMGLPAAGTAAMGEFLFLRVLCGILLLVSCANVAMLVFARTTTRWRELAIRAALGSGRTRIVAQLFVESLLVSGIAAVVGILGWAWTFDRLMAAMEAREWIPPLPYWYDLGVSSSTLVWAMGFAAVTALLVAAIPALRVSGNRIRQGMQNAGGGGWMRRTFGSVTGVLIAADTALAIAAIALAAGLSDRVRDALVDDVAGIDTSAFLAVEVSLPRESDESESAWRARTSGAQAALIEGLERENSVRSLAVGSALPRMDHDIHPFEVEGVEIEGTGRFASAGPMVSTAWVRPEFFAGLGQSVVSGRDFGSADLDADARVAIVNTGFVERWMQGRNVVGRRIRFPERGRDPNDAPWLEIVGVVPSMGMSLATPEFDAGVYFPARPGEVNPLEIAVGLGGDPQTFVPRLREILADVAPDLVLTPPRTLARIYPGNWYFFLATTVSIAVLVLVLVAIAASGIYAILSFSVAESTRELGVRTALGASRASLGLHVARRALIQLGIGGAIGLPAAGFLYGFAESGGATVATTWGIAGLAAVAVVGGIAFVAALPPTRRALSIPPTEALRMEG